MNILLTCIGNSDPYNDYSGKVIPGPLLTLLEEEDFDLIYLLYTEDMSETAGAACKAINKIYGHKTSVEYRPFLMEDPSDYPRLLRAMKSECIGIRRIHAKSKVNYFVQISGGTPQMQWTWLTLVQRNILPATVYAMHPRYIKTIKPPYHYIVEISELAEAVQPEVVELREQVENITAENNSLKLENMRMKENLQSSSTQLEIDILPEDFNLLEYLKSEKKRIIAAAHSRHPQNASDAARLIGIQPHTFRKEAEELGLRQRKNGD